MHVKARACVHPVVEMWATDRFTCITCYRRIRVVDTVPLPDFAPGVCQHVQKRPVSEAITRRLPYMDALCMDCGCIVRHPEGRGTWTPVMSYSFKIWEEL